MSLPSRILALLQFTRAALVFTALADTLAALLLRAGSLSALQPLPTFCALAASACLYLFGMSLNDLVDHRKDALLAASRPIPSGRLGVTTAHVVVTALGISALAFGGAYALLIGSATSFALLLVTLLLINFYNFAGKYLVSAGILTLGLIRCAHVLVAAPDVPVLWHPLWLFTHVVVISSVAYVWEEKRPRFSPVHSGVLFAGMVLTNILTVALVLYLQHDASRGVFATLHLTSWPLLVPIAATLAFVVIARTIARAVGTTSELGTPQPAQPEPVPDATLPPLRARRREAGRRLILLGLLYLIVLDAAFVAAFVSPAAGIVVLSLLPLAYLSVRAMRAAAAVKQLTVRPEFRRA